MSRGASSGAGPSPTASGWSRSASRKSARGGWRYVFAGTPVEQRVSCPNGLKRGCSLLSVASRSSQRSHFGALSSSISGVEVCSLWFGALLAGQVWQFRAETRGSRLVARRGRRALAGGLPVAVLDEGYDRLLSLAGQLIPWNFRFAYGSRSSLVSSDLAMLGVCQGLDGTGSRCLGTSLFPLQHAVWHCS